MKKQINVNWQKQLVFTAIAIVGFIFAANSQTVAQGKYKVGDRVECDTVGNGRGWRKATVIAFQEDDGYNGYSPDSGYFYRVKIDAFANNPEGQFCKSENMRLQAKVTPAENQNKADENNDNQPQANNKTENQSLKFKPGDRVECDKAQINSYEKGTVMPFRKGDFTDGERFRVRLDNLVGIDSDGILCKVDRMRLLAGEKPVKPHTTVGKVTEDEDGTVSADRPILDCPVNQKPVKNGTTPNPEVVKKVIRCQLGEKPAAKGSDGALTIDISALQVGSPRPWDRLRDTGGGTPGKTVVYPVKVTYTEKTFYRSKTVVGENRIYILNFFVNGFGEWQYGSGEKIKSTDYKDIPIDQ